MGSRHWYRRTSVVVSLDHAKAVIDLDHAMAVIDLDHAMAVIWYFR